MLTHLRHHRCLRLPSPRYIPRIPISALKAYQGKLMLSFRLPETGKPRRVITQLNAVCQPGQLDSEHIVCWGIQTDSPFHHVLLWDIAHQLPIGGTLTLAGDYLDKNFLEREYFGDAFQAVGPTYEGVLFQKVAQLDAELSGVDDWTFGIPAGPEDATMLNVCVQRILELEIPKKEIILCGRPGKDFRFWDRVRIVGEDITAPPVRITVKKNRIASEAKYENLCILHDRVMLPKNFYSAINAFGSAYPLSTFQSLYFDDKWNLIPRRYSDAGIAKTIGARINLGVMRNDYCEPSKYSPTVFGLLEKSEFLFSNPLRCEANSYPTGSLYLCKRKIWLRCPQNEALNWIEFEDVEHAERAADLGIPSRINPYALTQSMISRPLLSPLGVSHIELPSGRSGTYRSVLERFTIFPRKPLIKKTEAQALMDISNFARRYSQKSLSGLLSGSESLQRRRLQLISEILNDVRLPIQRRAIQEFISDYSKLVLGDQLPYAMQEHLIDQISEHGHHALDLLLTNSFQFLNQVGQRPRINIYARGMSEYLQKKSWLIRLGSFISALALGFQNYRAFYFPGGLWWRYQQIIDTTPFSLSLERGQ